MAMEHDDADERTTEQEHASQKAWDLLEDAEHYGMLSRDLGVDRVIALAQVYATLACRP